MTRVAIVGDPVLAGVSFAALRNPATGRFLIQDHSIQYSFGLDEAIEGLEQSRRGRRRRGTVLVVSDPSLSPGLVPDLPPLVHARQEARDVARMYPGARVLAGLAASTARVLQDLPSVTVFHFSGHARTAPDGQQGSQLMLTEPLSGATIAGLRLPRLELVILSACETLTFQRQRSYRLDGLAESFLAAGAGGVIGSAWQVDDRTTTRLMIDLHTGLRKGLSPAEALRAAQVAMIESPGTETGLKTWPAFRYFTR